MVAVEAQGATTELIDGGDHRSGDSLELDALRLCAVEDSGSITDEGRAPVFHSGFESSQVVNQTTCFPLIMADGFESGSTAGWSLTEP